MLELSGGPRMRSRLAKFNRSKLPLPMRFKLPLCVLVGILSVSCGHMPIGGDPPPCESPSNAGIDAFEEIMGHESISSDVKTELETMIATFLRNCEALDAYRAAP